MYIARCECFIAISTSSKFKIARSVVMRNSRYLLVVTHDPHCLHTHNHVLQNMTMNHPNTSVLHSESPTAPPCVDTGFGVSSVSVEICGITKDWIVALELLLVFYWIVSTVPTYK